MYNYKIYHIFFLNEQNAKVYMAKMMKGNSSQDSSLKRADGW